MAKTAPFQEAQLADSSLPLAGAGSGAALDKVVTPCDAAGMASINGPSLGSSDQPWIAPTCPSQADGRGPGLPGLRQRPASAPAGKTVGSNVGAQSNSGAHLGGVPGTVRGLDADPLRIVSLEELGRHCTPDDAWIALAGKVYNVTTWQHKHPGGQLPLAAVAGGDATDVFRAMHPPQVWGLLAPMLVGQLPEAGSSATEPLCPPTDSALAAPARASPVLSKAEVALVQDYRALWQRIRAEGLMAPDPSFYVARGSLLLLWWLGIVAGVVWSTSPGLHLLCAAALGIWWSQVNFVGHDAGHNSITGISKIDSTIGFFVGNTLTGISIGWWKRSHNVHHVACNSATHDPDLQHMPLFAVSDSFYKSLFSKYHLRIMSFDSVAQLLVAHQHLTFYPIMALARINLYAQSLLLLCSRTPLDHRFLEAATMAAFWLWYSALLACLPSWWERVAFFFVSHALTGILHVQLCLSHFSNPTYEGVQSAAMWARTQLLGSLDVTCSPWMDWFHGGLQFQIEHHLFPRVPRRNLRKIAPAVQAFCKKNDIPYTCCTFWEANVLTMEKLYAQAMNARAYGLKGKGAPDGGGSPVFFQSLLWDALNARG